MAGILKKSQNKGYILFEAILSFIVFSTIILSFVYAESLLMQRGKAQMRTVELCRVLYEETRDYRFHQGEKEREKNFSRQYQVSIQQSASYQSAQIIAGEEQLLIESKNP
ncbi:hypothetical protein BAU15_00135 [Enterococcus sp. JM4C]|uniref:hypothetical protein n=1 Tax=Candidatus Enterococcus huntleyi TaxID=1857217 RepID=UPI001379D40F|nr:hypothetical protein [Enterococcus sp. JM4C]KAF1299090.1 hypothetical protein BAU15_00135 [Enterococcus sp. JM4C]